MRYVKDEDPIRILFLLFLIFICYCFILQPFGFLKSASLRTNDFFSGISCARMPLPKEINDIVVVPIDSETINLQGYSWPWKRALFASLINRLASFGPKAIFIDFTFSRLQDAVDDLALSEAIKNAGCVVLAGYIDEGGNYIKSQDLFSLSAAATGIINKSFHDKDLIVRNMRAVTFTRGKDEVIDYSAEVKALALARGIPQDQVVFQPGKVFVGRQIIVPVDGLGSLPINYLASVKDFTAVPAYRILTDSGPSLNPDIFKNKIVMIGISANISHDIHPTPFGLMPGIYINANSLLTLLSGRFVYSLPSFSVLNLALLLLAMLAIGFISLKIRLVFLTAILVLSALAASNAYIFLQSRYNFRADIFSLFFLSGISFVVVEAYKYASLIVDSQRLKNLSIIDPFCQIYTQRYFQMRLQFALRRAFIGKNNYFCLLECKGISRLFATYEQTTAAIKAFADVVKKYSGKNALAARYGEDALSFVIWDTPAKKAGQSLSLILDEIKALKFSVDNEILGLKVKIAAVNFRQEHIEKYEDLVLTVEALLKRLGPDTNKGLVIFDPNIDKIVNVKEPKDEFSRMPKGELSYVSMDLEARNKELERALENLKKEQERIKELYFNAMHSLVKALEEKDQYTAGHSERVDIYSTALAKGLGLAPEEIEAIHKAAYVHDVGKIGLPDRILHKKERLDDNEFDIIKRHQADGAKILEGLPFFEEIVPMVLHHHERYDGKGYPHGLRGDMIPRGAQIIAIADSYDAMTTGRGYNSPLTIDEAIAELKRSSGSQFNPAYANKFIELLIQGKIKAL